MYYNKHKMKKALIVLSGGQDSTTCLFWALNEGYECSAITFHYNQLHSIEIDSAKKIVNIAKIKNHKILKLGSIFDGESPLTNSTKQLQTHNNLEEFSVGLQPTFVPSRNIVFLSLASNYAYSLGIETIVTGVCETDYAGYPDCRKEFIESLESSISLGLDKKIKILTPLIDIKKSDIVKLAWQLGPTCWNALSFSHTSYDGKYPPTNGDHANLLRAKGFLDAGLPDPLVLRAVKDGLMEKPRTKNYEDYDK